MVNCQVFATRLNKVLDDVEFPESMEDRERTFCEYFNVPIQKTHMILTGHLIPNRRILDTISDEFFIDADELLVEA
jgi:hypothetical protein